MRLRWTAEECSQKRVQVQETAIGLVDSRSGNCYVDVMFITFEGIDLSGKSTQAQRLCRRLESAGVARGSQHAVHLLREPGGTALSERLREILLDRSHVRMNPWTELFLFSAARAQLVTEVILPALQRGDIVICDRFYDSTTAYQGYGRGLDLEVIHRINRAATGGTDPDLTIVVDIPVELVDHRRAEAALAKDRMETSGKTFFERVRAGYGEIAAQEPHRVVRINGAAPADAVEQDVWRAVSRLGVVA